MLTISFNGSDERFLTAMRTKGPQIIAALTSKMSALMFLLQSYVVTQKLSGQVLKRRTGGLSGSIHVVPTKTVGTKIVGEVTGAGPPGNLDTGYLYGWVQELGGVKGAYPILAVKGRALSFLMNGKRVFARRVMHPQLPARPFMGPSQEEMAAQIEAGLNESVNKVVEE